MPPHHKRKRAPKNAAEIARIGAAYCGKFDALTEICRRHRMSYDALIAMAKAEGWPPRGLKGPRPNSQKTRTYRKEKPRTEAQQRADRHAEEAARDRELYGWYLDDVALLRRRGFAVNRDGDFIRFENRLITFPELREKAARERRLMEPLKTAAELVRERKGGRRPGHRKTPAERAKLSRAAKARWRAARAEIEARP